MVHHYIEMVYHCMELFTIQQCSDWECEGEAQSIWNDLPLYGMVCHYMEWFAIF